LRPPEGERDRRRSGSLDSRRYLEQRRHSCWAVKVEGEGER